MLVKGLPVCIPGPPGLILFSRHLLDFSLSGLRGTLYKTSTALYPFAGPKSEGVEKCPIGRPYELMTINEIINGKVCSFIFFVLVCLGKTPVKSLLG